MNLNNYTYKELTSTESFTEKDNLTGETLIEPLHCNHTHCSVKVYAIDTVFKDKFGGLWVRCETQIFTLDTERKEIVSDGVIISETFRAKDLRNKAIKEFFYKM